MLQVETRRNAAGETPIDLLSSIYRIQIRNEEKISETDRIFCENQQKSLYRTLDEIDRWYSLFVEEAARYKDSHHLSFTPDGRVKKHEPYRDYKTARTDYRLPNILL